MKSLLKIVLLVSLAPGSLLAQAGVRMSSDFLPLEVGNRWVYDVFNEVGEKTGTLEFAVEEYRIVSGRSFYMLTQFPFALDGQRIKLLRYDRQERQYMRIVDNDEGPLFLADASRVEVIQADDSGLPVKFKMNGDLMDLTFQRGMGIIEARMHGGGKVQIARLTALKTSDRKAAEAAAQGAPKLPPPSSQTASQGSRKLADTVLQPSADTVALDVQASSGPGGTKFVLTVINSTDKLVPFTFRTSQVYDFRVVDAVTGQEVWRWSQGHIFSTAMKQEALRPNRNWTFEVIWNHHDKDVNRVPPGSYNVIGSITGQPRMETDPVLFEVR